MGKRWVSLRMRAADREGRHRSGAERLVPLEHSRAAVLPLLERGWSALGAEPGRVFLTAEPIPEEQIRWVEALPARTVCVSCAQEGQQRAIEMLVDRCGVSPQAARSAVEWMRAGPNPSGGNMRGAMLLDRETGERLEEDPSRGVRVSCVDLDPASRARFDLWFQGGFPPTRFREAWTLAAKVATAETIVAELCWSDDPHYLPGYVASRTIGYVRFTVLKEAGNPFGGRAYFVDRSRFDRSALVAFLERAPVLVRLSDPSLIAEV
ncbi:MAG: 6-carboxyhexanoate--CoA ligase [Candidatus Poribacteria bacterium]|nr:MAG: 6-carboxyhexanoate--CoA ligase [Candidatus Poribacteria bacterium]